MNCLNPTSIMSPESRWLRKCIKEGRSFEYYYKHANVRRNLLLDPTPLVNDAFEYYDVHPSVRWQKVPCGKCDNCIKRKVNDYFVRSYFDYIDCISHGGSVYLVTLTFADELLPRLPDGEPCFDAEYIKAFLKRFRQYLNRKFNYNSKFEYLIVSEYGGEFFRPHHHGLFFLYEWPNTLSNQFLVKEAIAKSWTKVDSRGNWYANDELSLFDLQRVDAKPIEDSRGIRYACKYIGKQIGSEDFDARHLAHRWKRNHFQSIGLGSSITKYVDSNDYFAGVVSVDGYKYALPLYYQIKLKREFYCYSDDGSIIYQPTAFARDSARTFTLQKLQEYKDLSCLNDGFPKCPASLYDPDNLVLLEQWLSNYSGFDFANDFSGADPARFGDILYLVQDINDFFDAVDLWYKPKYEAAAYLYRKHQDEHYKKKKGLM